ncbi:MAG: hypothetical protein QW035_01200 [Candidatus Anstonellales archaeon]
MGFFKKAFEKGMERGKWGERSNKESSGWNGERHLGREALATNTSMNCIRGRWVDKGRFFESIKSRMKEKVLKLIAAIKNKDEKMVMVAAALGLENIILFLFERGADIYAKKYWYDNIVAILNGENKEDLWDGAGGLSAPAMLASKKETIKTTSPKCAHEESA